jgi:hypothetical protein
VAHVRVERLAAGRHQEDSAEHEKPVHSVAREEVDRVHRIDRSQHLKEKQSDQDRDGDRHDEGPEDRSRDLQTFHRGEDRDRRSDDAVSVEKSGAEDSQRDENPAKARGRLRVRAHEPHQREDSSLSPVVESKDVDGVLERHHDDQGPEDERQDSQNVFAPREDPVGGVKALSEGIEGTCADVAINHAQRGDAEDGQLPAAPRGAMRRRGGGRAGRLAPMPLLALGHGADSSVL